MRNILGLCLLLSVSISAHSLEDSPKRPVRPGVKTTGVQRQITAITPVAIFPVEGTPDWQVVTPDAVWVTNAAKNTVHRLDAKTNKVVATIEVGKKPCSGLAAGFGSIWAPNCGDKTVSRIDVKKSEVIATVQAGPANSEGGIAASADSVWMLSDAKGIISRIDPETNKVVAEIQVPAGSFACVVGEDGGIWISSTDNNLLARLDPKTNLVTDKIDVGPKPRFLAAGGGSIWTLNHGDGTVSRVDVKTKKLVQHVEVGVLGTGGEIAYGEGFVWVTAFDIPLSQIDPAANKVVKQWLGAGGDSVRAGLGSVWISNLRQGNVWRIDSKQN
jgi:YVTN family beta-propeller protein